MTPATAPAHERCFTESMASPSLARRSPCEQAHAAPRPDREAELPSFCRPLHRCDPRSGPDPGRAGRAAGRAPTDAAGAKDQPASGSVSKHEAAGAGPVAELPAPMTSFHNTYSRWSSGEAGTAPQPHTADRTVWSSSARSRARCPRRTPVVGGASHLHSGANAASDVLVEPFRVGKVRPTVPLSRNRIPTLSVSAAA